MTNTGLALIAFVYFAIGVVTLLIVKRYPKHFGASAEILETFFPVVLFQHPLDLLLALVIWTLWPLIILLGLFVPAMTLHTVLHAQESKLDSAKEIGLDAQCVTDLRPSGKIRLNGVLHEATSRDQFIAQGTTVKIVGKQGFSYLVEVR